jgi:2'-5' RNA ligase
VHGTPAVNVHLTVRVIGETDDATLARFAGALARVRVEPFILPVGGVGLFPARGPAKVIWAGVGNGHPRLHQLRKQVDEALLSVDSRILMPGFHPHFTIGRVGYDYELKQLTRFLDGNAAFEAPPFRVTEVQLLASEPAHGGPPRYQPVQTYPLEG